MELYGSSNGQVTVVLKRICDVYLWNMHLYCHRNPVQQLLTSKLTVYRSAQKSQISFISHHFVAFTECNLVATSLYDVCEYCIECRLNHCCMLWLSRCFV